MEKKYVVVKDPLTALPVKSATVTVQDYLGAAVTIYGSNSLSDPLASSTLTTDVYGMVWCYLPNGRYQFVITPPSATAYTLTDIIAFDEADATFSTNWASPGAIGSVTPNSGAFTTLAASGTVSGAGFTALLAPYAPLASPALTGTPTAPTASADTNSTQIATAAFVQSTNTSLVSATRLGKMSVTTAAATGTYTASEVIVKTALGGLSKVLSSYSQAINLATTGAGGMDTGTAPVSGYVSLYAIYGTSGTSILACNATTSSGEVYGGANMPAGYTYSALIGIWPTNGSSQFVAGLINDREFFYQTFATIFSGGSQIATLTLQSISAGVPPTAKRVDVSFTYNTASTTAGPAAIAADATGTGGQAATLPSAGSQATIGGIASYGWVSFKCVPIITSQTVYVAMPVSGTSYGMYVSGYLI